MRRDEAISALKIMAKGEFYPSLVKEADGWHARWLVADGTFNAAIDRGMRDLFKSSAGDDLRDIHFDTLHDAWLAALKSRSGLISWDEGECEEFSRHLTAWAKNASGHDEAKNNLLFTLGTLETGVSIECPRPAIRPEYLVLGEALAISPALRALAPANDRPDVLRVELEGLAAERFLRVDLPALLKEGFIFHGEPLKAPVAAEVELESADDGSKPANAESKITSHVTIRVAGEVVSARDIRFLLDQNSTLVFFRNRWIEVDLNILREALRVLERENGRKMGRMEAIAFAQGLGGLSTLQIASLRAHGWVKGLVNMLREKGALDDAMFKPSKMSQALRKSGFAFSLRTYQVHGAAWLMFMTEHGFGALLADDMGLGKTAQTLAWLVLRAEKSPVLIVAPLSLVANWRNEFSKFLPESSVYIHHGDFRHTLEGPFADSVRKAGIVLTSYNLVVKDNKCFASVEWGAIVADEAQVFKNPDTQIARAMCSFNAPCRIALTGTPIENSVADLWSIERFLNPGLLPDRKNFTENFVRPIATSRLSFAAKRLKNALEPFILRRLKDDVASELGEKKEIREYCELSQTERLEYEVAFDDYKSGERSKGDVFRLITSLKLVCDGMTSDFASGGKFARLCDLLESIFDAGESALIFTQYAKVGERLKIELEKRFSTKVPFLHGKLSASSREREIASFNEPGPKAFILSLRTGGLGLNLIKATRVIHYDRWWNPAVEEQATDRAHRIGQTHVVFVHLMIASGTIEDRVDRILLRKQNEAETVISSGESFLANLAPEEFAKIATLEPLSR